ncbi:MAG: hypothetical protein U1E40_17770 [Amaricoccus sp.]
MATPASRQGPSPPPRVRLPLPRPGIRRLRERRHRAPRQIFVSTVFGGQKLGLREVETDVWLVSFMHYDLGYFDLEGCKLKTIDTPFGSRVSPM